MSQNSEDDGMIQSCEARRRVGVGCNELSAPRGTRAQKSVVIGVFHTKTGTVQLLTAAGHSALVTQTFSALLSVLFFSPLTTTETLFYSYFTYCSLT